MKDIPRPIVKLKGFRDGLHLFIDPEANIEDILPRIEKHMEKLGDSLAGTGVTINLGGGSLGAQELSRVEQLLQDTYGLEIKQLIGKSDGIPLPLEGPQIAGAPALHQVTPQNGEYILAAEEEKNIIHPTDAALRTGRTLLGRQYCHSWRRESRSRGNGG